MTYFNSFTVWYHGKQSRIFVTQLNGFRNYPWTSSSQMVNDLFQFIYHMVSRKTIENSFNSVEWISKLSTNFFIPYGKWLILIHLPYGITENNRGFLYWIERISKPSMNLFIPYGKWLILIHLPYGITGNNRGFF